VTVWAQIDTLLLIAFTDSFSIDYVIYAGNMIDERTGKLGVVVEMV